MLLLSLPTTAPRKICLSQPHLGLTRVGEEVEDEGLVGVHAAHPEFLKGALQLHDGVVSVGGLRKRGGRGGREGGRERGREGGVKIQCE